MTGSQVAENTSNSAVSVCSGCKMKLTVSKGHFDEFSESFSYQAFPTVPVNKTGIAGPWLLLQLS